MDDSEKVRDMLCLLPPILLYSIAEINRGWNILKHKKYSLSFAFSMQASLVRLFQGEEKSIEYKEKLLNNAPEMKLSGYYSLIGGVVVVAVCLYWIYLLIK